MTLFDGTRNSPADAAPPPVVGLGARARMTMWDESFCQAPAAESFHVIRFDNRDTGLSTKIEGGPAPGVMKTMSGVRSTASSDGRAARSATA